MKKIVCLTDYGFASIEVERSIIESSGAELCVGQCRTAEDVIRLADGAEVLLVQWAPVTKQVLDALPSLRGVVRYGIGVDNIDLVAARERGLQVANVPDYCIDEVADHSVALALSCVRQIKETGLRLSGGEWKIMPPRTMPALREMTFATAGFGRIARAVLARAKAFGCRLAAFDPYVDEAAFRDAGVRRLDEETLFDEADILSLHLPLNDSTRHFANADRLARMRPHAVLVNTARGGLIDTHALAAALAADRPGFAGLDVFETEPLEPTHPILHCSGAVLTSHTAWYSSQSILELQRLAAEEAARMIRGESVRNPVL